MSERKDDREDCRSCDNLLDQVRRLSTENAELRAEVQLAEALVKPTEQQRDELKAERDSLKLQAQAAEKLLNEFTTNKTVCQALGPTCIGGHQEDPCKCLYCRTRHQLSLMD